MTKQARPLPREQAGLNGPIDDKRAVARADLLECQTQLKEADEHLRLAHRRFRKALLNAWEKGESYATLRDLTGLTRVRVGTALKQAREERHGRK